MAPDPLVPSALTRAFEELYDRPPTHIARAPGRVNLIGEHIDYHDLPVMPFAINRAVHVVFAPAAGGAGDTRVRIATDEGHLESDSFELSPEIESLAAGDWRNYVRAAARALASEHTARMGMDAWVTSDLPVAAGLSSSSALVVAVGLALGRTNELVVGRRAFADLMARAERMTGTAGGGMDQAASLLSVEGCVSWIDFNPLWVEHVEFPKDLSVLLVDSGAPAEKSGELQHEYNERRETGRAALVCVAEALARPGATFRELLTELTVEEILVTADAHLDPRSLSRFRHVVTEYQRVLEARRALTDGDATALGRVLFASHTSLREDYGVSTPKLDEFVQTAGAAGALGARLTGAGFGGSIVALTTLERRQPVRDVLVAAAGSEARVLEVQPSAGAQLLEL